MSLDRAKYIINELISSVKLLYDSEHYYPSIMLEYVLIDTCGWLKYGGTNPTNKSFKDWVKKYILLESFSFPFNDDDLWSHRCGLLHMFSSESRDFSQGRARSIAYSFKSKGYDQLVKFLKVKDREGRAVPMDVEKFTEALLQGASKFLSELSSPNAIDENIEARLWQLEQFKLTNFKNI